METEALHKKKLIAPKLRFKGFDDAWRSCTLNDVTQYVKGFAFKSEDYKNEGIRIIRVSDLGADRIKTDNDKIFIDTKNANLYQKYKLMFGNIIITTVGSKPDLLESAVGRGIFIKKNDEGLLNQNLLKFDNIKGVENGFIMGLINSKKYQLHIKGIARGNANQANITVVDLLQYKLSIPSLPEQQKIASFLSSVDEKIQQLTRKKELLEQYKKGVMQELFSGQLRFKDGNGKAFPKWEEKRIWEVSEKKSSNIAANSITENVGNYKIYGATGFLRKVDFYREEEPYISIVKDGAGVGRTLLCDAKTSVLGTLDIIKPITNVDLYYLYSVLNNIDFVKYTKGSTIPHIYYKDYSNEKVQLPHLEEQKMIANYLSSIDNKIEFLNKQITQTQTFKKGLLQQMFV